MFFFKSKPKPKKVHYSYKVNIQPDITIQELARIAFDGFRFGSERDRDLFFSSLPPECQRHLERKERQSCI